MALIKNPLCSFSASGTIADDVNFRQRSGKTIAQSRPIPTDQKTDSQLLIRSNFRLFQDQWQFISSFPFERAAWDLKRSKDRNNPTAYNQYLSDYLSGLKGNKNLMFFIIPGINYIRAVDLGPGHEYRYRIEYDSDVWFKCVSDVCTFTLWVYDSYPSSPSIVFSWAFGHYDWIFVPHNQFTFYWKTRSFYLLFSGTPGYSSNLHTGLYYFKNVPVV
jgi:hypothetical protein